MEASPTLPNRALGALREAGGVSIAVLVLGVLGGLTLIVAELSPVITIDVLTTGTCQEIADARVRDACEVDGIEQHGGAFILLGLLAIVMAVGRRPARQPAGGSGAARRGDRGGAVHRAPRPAEGQRDGAGGHPLRGGGGRAGHGHVPRGGRGGHVRRRRACWACAAASTTRKLRGGLLAGVALVAHRGGRHRHVQRPIAEHRPVALLSAAMLPRTSRRSLTAASTFEDSSG